MERERNVVVTGGGTGIGLAVSRLLHERGWSVIGAGLEKDEAFPEEARFVECDVTDKEAVASLFSPLDRLSGLVTCAGIIRFDKEWDPEVFEQVMGVNVTRPCLAAPPRRAMRSVEARGHSSTLRRCGAGSAIRLPRPMARAREPSRR